MIATIQTVLVGACVRHGLGRHFDTLSEDSIAGYHKVSIYAILRSLQI